MAIAMMMMIIWCCCCWCSNVCVVVGTVVGTVVGADESVVVVVVGVVVIESIVILILFSFWHTLIRVAHIALIGLSNVTSLISVSHVVVYTSSLGLILKMANFVKQENTSIFFHWLHQHTAVFSLVSCVGQRRLVK